LSATRQLRTETRKGDASALAAAMVGGFGAVALKRMNEGRRTRIAPNTTVMGASFGGDAGCRSKFEIPGDAV